MFVICLCGLRSWDLIFLDTVRTSRRSLAVGSVAGLPTWNICCISQTMGFCFNRVPPQMTAVWLQSTQLQVGYTCTAIIFTNCAIKLTEPRGRCFKCKLCKQNLSLMQGPQVTSYWPFIAGGQLERDMEAGKRGRHPISDIPHINILQKADLWGHSKGQKRQLRTKNRRPDGK